LSQGSRDVRSGLRLCNAASTLDDSLAPILWENPDAPASWPLWRSLNGIGIFFLPANGGAEPCTGSKHLKSCRYGSCPLAAMPSRPARPRQVGNDGRHIFVLVIDHVNCFGIAAMSMRRRVHVQCGVLNFRNSSATILRPSATGRRQRSGLGPCLTSELFAALLAAPAQRQLESRAPHAFTVLKSAWVALSSAVPCWSTPRHPVGAFSFSRITLKSHAPFYAFERTERLSSV